MQRTALVLAAAAVLAACTTGPDYQRPPLELPPALQARAPAPAASAHAAGLAGSERLKQADAGVVAPPLLTGGAELLDTAWWSAFGDPVLDELIQSALAGNKDLKIAAHRIEQFDAFLQVSKSAGGPQAGADASRLRNTLSENRQVPLAAGTQPVDNDYQVSVRASWELDLWGRVRRANESALADLMAAEENRRALVQSLVAEVASAYVRLRGLDRALELLNEQIAAQRETLRLAELKFRNGGTNETPVVRALADLAELQGGLPLRQAEIAQLENALSQMLGRNPGPLPRGKTVAQLVLPAVPAGLPAEVLTQRPDVRRSEQELVSANAKIGVAKAQYLPTISLTAGSGFASNELSKLTQLTSNFGSFGLTILGPLFTSGRIAGEVRAAEAVQKQAEVSFLRSLQTALHEVEDALTGHARNNERVAFAALQVKALQEQRELALKRFNGGGAGYLEVLEAERQLNAGLQAQNQVRREQFASLVAVYKAIGGGWSLAELKATNTPSAHAAITELRQ